ncbi:ligase-associated DNA damage response exonuclease [Pelagovum pacificum]|uniref:Ligase-associated DNA damage response exonuclease n=1 Tax=Pelagovum pacificum TaxID=2588711 RepID=A0A5C5GEK1_9RHOB|nr:ligase-associated DNA damage response exonuclease [Pelagovum pacificum]QQA43694.1 ligase-associated DNA damage response exonuclease [Pelagovum pacificum]TNY33175.1 ligase-associated DNA damage response exonuclease [Pelagovum pacificum]
MSEVLTFTDSGIYCPAGDFYVDPWRPVDRALITHGHSDHAREGMGRYLATPGTAPILRHRLGDVAVRTLDYGKPLKIGDATVSFHPAGHVPGSAQIRIEVKGEVWVVSGDYKVVDDGLSEPFEPVPCHAFITECTFGLPVFNWTPLPELKAQLNDWWAANAAEGRASILGAYSLGKAQRLLAMLDPSIGPILTHGAVENTNDVLRAEGFDLPNTTLVTPDTNAKDHPGALVLAPPSALGSPWARRFGQASSAFASGWMALRGVRRRRAADRGFVVSDHADWHGLNKAIGATGAERVFVTHGYTSVFRRWLEEQGYDAAIVETQYEGESLDTDSPSETGEPSETGSGSENEQKSETGEVIETGPESENGRASKTGQESETG